MGREKVACLGSLGEVRGEKTWAPGRYSFCNAALLLGSARGGVL
jgi:hypothetical protein